jgi:hypothetical protein
MSRIDAPCGRTGGHNVTEGENAVPEGQAPKDKGERSMRLPATEYPSGWSVEELEG